MLYCVYVSSGRSYSFGSYQEPEPSRSDGWEVWEADSEEELESDIWQSRVNHADGYSRDHTGYFICHSCEDHRDEDCESCPNCGDTDEPYEEEVEEDEHTESNSSSEWVVYDPSDRNHAELKGCESQRPEHEVAMRVLNAERIAATKVRLRKQILVQCELITAAKVEKARLEQELLCLY